MTTPQDWLSAFAAALSARDIPGVAALFHEDGYWRDLLTFTWNVKTLEGRPAIAAMLRETLARTAPSNWRITEPPETVGADTNVWLAFDTTSAYGTGRLTLRDGRAFILFTCMADLKGHEEPRGTTRPKGIVHKADRARRTWSENRASETMRIGIEDQPYTLIIGGGQGGLALAARLKQLGVPTLIVEKNARAGDSWRNRYRSLVLHDPVWYDHLPYLPFPETWPVFTPKDKMGDWLEAYASIFELDVWTSTTCNTAHRNEQTQDWNVTVTRDGQPLTLRPKQLVFATGAYGPPKHPDWPGIDTFEGTLIHSSAYRGAAPYRGKRAVVIGSASSAHDVAVDLWEAGAEVTMIQRSPTIVVRSETLMDLGFDIYSEDAMARGITTEKADLIGAATPMAVFTEDQKDLYKLIRTRDAAFYDRLASAGFALTFGPDDSGLMMQAMRTASGYYIDVGASDLIADHEIRAISGAGVAAVTPTGLTLTDGRQVQADVIIACTGYQSMNESVAGIVSRQAADATGPCWGLGSGITGDPGPWQGEPRNMWKPTAVPNLWYHGGNLALSRFYSRILALQLKARMEGIPTPVYAAPKPHKGL
ncbi:MAG: NAD(P)/FAD-dependent oxidoreductase [Rhodobacterales bacterium]|nr:NAD(P)/FAD-dependent oxidoreductase [Rhodobacterales bacterium]